MAQLETQENFREFHPRLINCERLIWTAYLDESGTHDSPIMLMGGYLANNEQWKTFNAAWESLLKHEGITSCHGKELLQGKKEFKSWSRQRRHAFVLKAQDIIVKNLELGLTAIAREDDYESLYKGQLNPDKLRGDTKYGILFRGCLFLVESAVTGNKVPPKELRPNFVMEGGQ